MSYNKKTTEFDFDGLRFGLKSSNQAITSRLQQNMLESFKNTVCSECQGNRVVCILRPKCQNRHFQDLLLFSGYKSNDIPTFCYSVRLKEIFENYQKKVFLLPDISIYLNDFYKIFGNKKPKQNPLKEFDKLLNHFNIQNSKKYDDQTYLLTFNKNLLFVDLKKELITINPLSWQLNSPKLIKSIIELYAKEYNLAVTVYEEYDFLLVLTFNFGKKKLDQELMNIAIRKSDFLMDYDEESNELTGEIHFTSQSQSLRSEESGLSVKDILKLFDHISESLVGTIKTSQSPLSSLIPKR
ncbi:MAG: hypothetical protein HeimC3_47710 [Candidatus Heimdallarchaeota archaeon LC_3]|nr:MAG: hypothetical protein HeimC3_47710 [Candidatus Heimdallarchaeota archaeon LC_3]